MLSSVCLSVCHLSVTLVHPTQAVQIFCNVSTALGTLAIHWHPLKISRRSSQGNPSARGVKHKRGSQAQRFSLTYSLASERLCLISHCCLPRLRCTGSSPWPCCAGCGAHIEYSVVAKRLALRAFRTNTTTTRPRPHPLAAPRPASCWVFNNGLYFYRATLC